MQFRFGSCRVDREVRQVVRDGRERHLSPKAFELLLVLIDERPRVIAKQTLIDRLWPDTFVADANLSVLIAELRKALGDSARAPGLIRTHHRVGYSFAAAVVESASASRAAGPTFILQLERRKVALVQGSSTVGRDEDCEVVVADASVSRRHARFVVEGLTVSVEDLESKNGTRVNGQRIAARAPLRAGDEVHCGNVRMLVIAAPGADTSTVSLDGQE